ncbi:MAG: class II aldolase/adducin family protein [Defluviitaleaceae bacterium]|nr:class II aldolase/adducin family protein [Defluviitaleaceae bacterium]
MKLDYLHPADQLVAIMKRIYDNGLTTTSGGNLSIMEDNGDVWITPSGIDKGALSRSDICLVKPDGTVFGPHKPSMELPSHAMIYKKRPDIRAILHAHPPRLVAFSVARRLPELNILSNARHACGKIVMAPYTILGSQELGDVIADEFTQGYNIVVLENHGLVVGGGNLFDCFMKFETLEALAKTQINAGKCGTLKTFTDAEFALTSVRDHMNMIDFVVSNHSAEECAARRDMVTFMKRAYKQGLLGSTSGTFSARLSNGMFLITPYGSDRAYLSEEDLVLIHGDRKEYGKTPSRSVRMHKLIYDRHPAINAVLGAQPPHAMAFAVTDAAFDTRIIPESYIQLRNMRKVGFTELFTNAETVADAFSEQTPVIICENNQVLATGGTLLHAFDRLEVCEATAYSIIAAREIGGLVHITDEEIAAIDKAFNLPD